MERKLASVIVPVYNSEKYLENCARSVLDQTYDNFELILIDDGSKDGSYEIMEKLHKECPDKVRIYKQENSGVAITRNRAIEYAKGEYLFFMDNDDWMDSDFVERLMDAFDRTDADYVIGGYRQVRDGEVVANQEPKDCIWSRYKYVVPWARAFKKSFMVDNKIEFLNVKMGEETYIAVLCAILAKKVCVVEDYIGYNNRLHAASVSASVQKGFKEGVSPIPMLRAIHDFIDMDALTSEQREYLEYFYLRYNIWYLLYSGRGTGKKKMQEQYRAMYDLLKEYFPNYRKNKIVSLTKPDGETTSSRLIIWMFDKLEKLHLDKAVYNLYARI